MFTQRRVANHGCWFCGANGTTALQCPNAACVAKRDEFKEVAVKYCGMSL